MHKQTIALVDDEQSILTSVSIALKQEGFDVDVFSNGEEAISELETKKYDLVLFDMTFINNSLAKSGFACAGFLII